MKKDTIEGEYTTATLVGGFEQFDQSAIDQVQEMVDHEAFTNEVVVQADGHWGNGAVIGFTMKSTEKVIPGVVGVDCGCGIDAFHLEDMWDEDPQAEFPIDFAEFDEKVREAVPFGYTTHKDQQYHMGEDFPYEKANKRLGKLLDHMGEDAPAWFTGYDLEYFKELCKRTGTDMGTAINQVGTLGGGNHFVELCQAEGGHYAVLIHSGSRKLGLQMTHFWEDKADEQLLSRKTGIDVPDFIDDYAKFDIPETSYEEARLWFSGGKGESWYDMDKIRETFSGEEIEVERQQLVQWGQETLEAINQISGPLAYLEGGQKLGYLIDMIFCQVYADENRRRIMELIKEETGLETDSRIMQPHNYVSPDDGIIRKGAISAHDMELGVIPFNMSSGALIVQGLDNPEFNYSAPHGAGRAMSRTEAEATFSVEEMREDMEGVYSSSINEETLDEYSGSYKDPETIRENIEDTVEIVMDLKPMVNLKDDKRYQ